MWSQIGQWLDANPITLMLIAVLVLVLIVKAVTSGQNELIENQGELIKNQGSNIQSLFDNMQNFVLGVSELKNLMQEHIIKQQQADEKQDKNQGAIMRRLDRIEDVLKECKEWVLNDRPKQRN
jgi:predicted PurR-regulated permease PerM